MTSPHFVISDEAKGDLLSIEAYIGEHGGEMRAAAAMARIMKSIDNIAFMPGMGTWRSYLKRNQRGFSVPPWTIFYKPLPDGGIEVVRIVDGRRNLPVLFGRKS